MYWVEHKKEEPLIHVYSVAEPLCCNDWLTLEVPKTGWGLVTARPAGINCGADCEEDYLEATSVELTATPLSDAQFRLSSG